MAFEVGAGDRLGTLGAPRAKHNLSVYDTHVQVPGFVQVSGFLSGPKTDPNRSAPYVTSPKTREGEEGSRTARIDGKLKIMRAAAEQKRSYTWLHFGWL